MGIWDVTSSGFSAPTGAEILAEIQDDYESQLTALGLPASIDWTRDDPLGILATAFANRLGLSAQALQALYDSFQFDNAEGTALDAIGLFLGLPRNDATRSTATVTITGDPGTVIPIGSEVEGGGDNDDVRWTVTAAVTVPSGGTIDTTVEAVEAGAYAAIATAIDLRITRIAGWTAVSNAAAASTGSNRETDSEYRLRLIQSRQKGANTVKAIRQALLSLSYITSAVVVQNNQSSTQIVEGIIMAAHSIAIIIAPNTITTAQQEEVAATIWANIPAVVETTALTGGVTATVIDAAGVSQTLYFGYAVDVSVDVAITMQIDTTLATEADITANINAAVTAFFAAATTGQEVYDLDMVAIAAAVTGVQRASALVNSGSTVTINAFERAVEGTVTVVVGVP